MKEVQKSHRPRSSRPTSRHRRAVSDPPHPDLRHPMRPRPRPRAGSAGEAQLPRLQAPVKTQRPQYVKAQTITEECPSTSLSPDQSRSRDSSASIELSLERQVPRMQAPVGMQRLALSSTAGLSSVTPEDLAMTPGYNDMYTCNNNGGTSPLVVAYSPLMCSPSPAVCGLRPSVLDDPIIQHILAITPVPSPVCTCGFAVCHDHGCTCTCTGGVDGAIAVSAAASSEYEYEYECQSIRALPARSVSGYRSVRRRTILCI